MADFPEPLVPADCDLRDFQFTPVEFQRLFSSETWLLANDAEKVAAITLWGRCWSQVPAGSMPSDDRLLAQLSGAGSRWKRVRDIAMRGWVLCTDGRYYHPVMSEKALEAWLEKLTQRVSSAAGNAKRWGSAVDLTDTAMAYMETRELLVALNPRARSLSKPVPKSLLEAVQEHAAGSPKKRAPDSRQPPDRSPGGIAPGVPTGVPPGSQGTGTGNNSVESPVVELTDSEVWACPVGCDDAGWEADRGSGPEDYRPGRVVRDQLRMAGIPLELVTPVVLAEFRVYWLPRLPRAGPEELDTKFFQRMTDLKVRGVRHGQDPAGGRSGGRRPSLSERVRGGGGDAAGG